jgi:(R,R)-butanediol dehydrogenase / meso-butanediol dehydrogenase / diacetyl reductase
VRAAVVQGEGLPLAVESVDDPAPGPGELVLAVEACGICGSDLHLAEALPIPGLVLGHEFCGTVAAVGPEVVGWAVGDLATALSLRTCGTCVACRSGRPRKCLAAEMVGVERPGAYAELVAVAAHDARRLPEGFDPRHGALVEPLAVALHTVERAALVPGEAAVVLGAGPVGLAVALWLAALGAGEVVVSDPVPSRRALAERLGASATVDPSELAGSALAAAVAERCGGPPPLVVECVGVPGLIGQACDVAATDGRVVVAGVCMGPDQLLPLVPMAKELDLRFAFYYRDDDWRHTIRSIERGRLDPEPLLTDEVDLDATPAAFDALRRPTTQCKVLVRPNR